MLDTTTLTKRRWSNEDDARLAELRTQGRTDREIAAALDRTCEAVTSHRQWLRKMAHATDVAAPQQQEDMKSHRGLPWSPVEDARLADLRRCEHSDDLIALALGRTTSAVRGRVSKLKARGLGRAVPSLKRPSQWTPERVAEARTMRSEGLTQHQIAIRLGTDAATVGRALRSPEAIEDSPGEGVGIGCTVPDIGRAANEVEMAKATLAKAEARYAEAMEPILTAMRDAIHRAGLVPGPEEDDRDDGWPEPAQVVFDLLRRQGIELRVRA